MSLLEARSVGLVRRPPGQVNGLPVNLLKANNEHRAVRLSKNRLSDLDHVVRSNCEEEAVEGRMVELAECQAITDNRIALEVAIWRDMGGVEELVMPELAESTTIVVGPDHPLAKRHLMQPPTEGGGDVGSAGLWILCGTYDSRRSAHQAAPMSSTCIENIRLSGSSPTTKTG